MDRARELLGRWQLVSWTAVDGVGRVERPFGERPDGILVYLPDGWMAAQFAGTDRPVMSPVPFAASEAEQARAFATYLA